MLGCWTPGTIEATLCTDMTDHAYAFIIGTQDWLLES